MHPNSRCGLPVLAAALFWAVLCPARAQICSDYSRHFHWIHRVALSGQLAHLALHGRHGYLTDQVSGLQILDFTDPIHPQWVRSFDLPGQAWDVCIRGDHAYVSAFDQGLQIVDISDPSNPILVGSVWSSSAINLQVFGTFVYMADFFSSRVYVISLEDPANPEVVAEVQTGGWAWDVAISEPDKLMAVSATYSIVMVDISDPFLPRRLGAVPVSDAVYEVAVEGHYAYAAGVAGLYVVDFEDPAHPIVVGQAPVSSEAILVRDGFAFLGTRDNGITVVDVRDPTNPILVGHCFIDGWPFGLTASGDLLYAVDFWRGINVYRVESPMAVQSLGSLETPSTRCYVSVAEPYAYIADVVGGLLVADVSLPAYPRLIGRVEVEGHAWGITEEGGYAYLPCDSPGLRIFDVADPKNPVLVGSALAEQASRVAVRDGFAYVLGDPSGLLIVDVHDPTDPKLVGSAPVSATDLELRGELAYLASAAGVKVVDIGDPTQPHVLSSVDTGFSPRSLAGDEGHLYVGGEGESFTGKFASMDLADPRHPVLLDCIGTLRPVIDAERNGKHVWLTEDPVLIVDVSDPEDLRITGMIELTDSGLDMTFDVALGKRLAVGCNNPVQVLPCNLPVATHCCPGGTKPPPTSRLAALAGEPGAPIRLGFSSPVRGASIEIIDVSGRMIRRLALEDVPADPLGVTWDTKTEAGQLAAPGVYFARTTGGTRSQVRRLIVVR